MNDQEYMQLALEQAKIAYDKDEVPVGAIIVYKDKVIASAYNSNFTEHNPIVHAEIKAIEQACQFLKTSDLSQTKLYVTLEPCMMCHGAIINARIKDVYFGTFDLKKGSILSNQHIKDDKRINWHYGILEEECKAIIQSYFIQKRGK